MQRIEFPTNSIRLCFDSCDTDLYEGRICGVALENEIEFQGMSDLIIKIDDAFNVIGQPQPHQVLRSFARTQNYQSYNSNPKRYNSSPQIAEKRGRLRTVDLLMISRHRAEWQGFLINLEDPQKRHFKSSLECMELLKNMLTE